MKSSRCRCCRTDNGKLEPKALNKRIIHAFLFFWLT